MPKWLSLCLSKVKDCSTDIVRYASIWILFVLSPWPMHWTWQCGWAKTQDMLVRAVVFQIWIINHPIVRMPLDSLGAICQNGKCLSKYGLWWILWCHAFVIHIWHIYIYIQFIYVYLCYLLLAYIFTYLQLSHPGADEHMNLRSTIYIYTQINSNSIDASIPIYFITRTHCTLYIHTYIYIYIHIYTQINSNLIDASIPIYIYI